jgi:uncharacterized protein
LHLLTTVVTTRIWSEILSKDTLDYGKLIDEAMHYLVRRALKIVQEEGLAGDHHFFITFDSQHPDVAMSDELRKRYPEEMTIVLQHQFWDLEVDEKQFSLVLSFDNIKNNLTIPFDSLISFADPSVKFGLQFSQESDKPAKKAPAGKKAPTKKGLSSGTTPPSDGKGNVVTLDAFRKKDAPKKDK